MTDQTQKEIERVYTYWKKSFMEKDSDIERLNSILSDKIMGYGTTLEEKCIGKDAVIQLAKTTKEQSKAIEEICQEETTVVKQFFSGEEVAVIVEEIKMTYKIEGQNNSIPFRMSTIITKENDKWQITHWHGSVAVETEDGDTWHLEEWKLKNKKLQEKVDEQTATLKATIEDLKATQAQLIHSEKMASLGELTAGIAHEIKNPLNFVNNFSEVSKELLEELLDELKNGDLNEVETIAKDLTDNLDKIVHHGKRADSIVKGMLQHSRSGDGQKEFVDINEMIDEYLRLAYHGHRAKKNSFNATLLTDFDDQIPKLNIIPQEIGRVILNLFTNAFYTLDERKNGTEEKSSPYSPTIAVKTKLKNDKVVIEIEDNGKGIQQTVLDKIFQPFFTTKPTGIGTGLGLSLSYDIIKAHNGKLEAESEEGKGTKFTITLPTTENLDT